MFQALPVSLTEVSKPLPSRIAESISAHSLAAAIHITPPREPGRFHHKGTVQREAWSCLTWL